MGEGRGLNRAPQKEGDSMKEVSLRQALKLLGFTNVTFKKGYNFCTAYADYKDGKTYYISHNSRSDYGSGENPSGVMCRTTPDRTSCGDGHGNNEWWISKKLRQEHNAVCVLALSEYKW